MMEEESVRSPGAVARRRVVREHYVRLVVVRYSLKIIDFILMIHQHAINKGRRCRTISEVVVDP